jgi:leucyl-tRNA synthetase
MALYNHAAVWHERPELWPRGYYTNGHVNLNNEKMAKSTGNFLMLEEAVEKFSADATRLALGFAGDSMENANFETDTANAATSMLFLEDKFVAEVVAEQAAGTLRTGEMLKMDTNVLNEVNRLLAETESCFDKMLWRDGLNAGSAQLRLLRDFYREWCGRSAVALHAEVVLRYVEVSTLVLAPVCPHYAERVWREHLGRPGSVLKEGRWPQLTAPVDAKASRELRFLQKTLKNLRASCAKDKTKAPTKGLIFIADGYNDWKVKTLVYMQTLWKAEKGAKDPNAGSLPEKKDLMQALTSGLLQDPSMAKLKKDVMQFAAYVADEAAEGLGLAALDTTMPFDQFEVLAESREYLSKHLVIGCVLELELYNLSSADVPGDDKKKAAAEPGKPSMVLM